MKFWSPLPRVVGIYIPTLAKQVLLSNREREAAGFSPSINLVALGIGNGCSGTESASCGSRPGAKSFSETEEGITLRFLKDHALLSTEVYERVQAACAGVTGATPLNRYSDCFVDVPWDVVTDPPEGCRGPYSNTTTPDNEVTCLTKDCYHSALSLNCACEKISIFELLQHVRNIITNRFRHCGVVRLHQG